MIGNAGLKKLGEFLRALLGIGAKPSNRCPDLAVRVDVDLELHGFRRSIEASGGNAFAQHVFAIRFEIRSGTAVTPFGADLQYVFLLLKHLEMTGEPFSPRKSLPDVIKRHAGAEQDIPTAKIFL